MLRFVEWGEIKFIYKIFRETKQQQQQKIKKKLKLKIKEHNKGELRCAFNQFKYLQWVIVSKIKREHQTRDEFVTFKKKSPPAGKNIRCDPGRILSGIPSLYH